VAIFFWPLSCPDRMQTNHYNHLLTEGFNRAQINQLIAWGVRSINFGEAKAIGFYKKVSNPERVCGMIFPFTGKYGQLRCDYGSIKYLSPCGSKVQPWFPDNLIPQVITEGFKDAAIATLSGGIPTGAIAGVTHYKCLPPGQGQVIVFDADAHTNAQVFSALAKAAQWTGGKVAIIPIEYGAKAGLCEFLRKQQSPGQAYQALISSALDCKDFLWQLPTHWVDLPPVKRSNLFKTLIPLYQQCFPNDAIEPFVKHLKSFAPQENLANFVTLSFSSPRSTDSSILLAGTVPLEICLCRQNQDLLQNGVDNCRVPAGFKLAADLVGVVETLERLGLRYWQTPISLLADFGRKSGLKDSQIKSIWKSANSEPRTSAVPENKIRDRVIYYLRTQSA
jgi:hypothetical protein